MLPTPSTSHIDFNKVYEPAEDSFLFIDALSQSSEVQFLKTRFPETSVTPVICEIGCGSGILITFLTTNSHVLLGRSDIVSIAIDLNPNACISTQETFNIQKNKHHFFQAIQSDLSSSLRDGLVDIIMFNPPYVPSEEQPHDLQASLIQNSFSSEFQRESNLLALSYAGGTDGMKTTNRFLDTLQSTLSPRGIAYVLLCAQNKPLQVIKSIESWGNGWNALTIADSGRKAGWESLKIIRIWNQNYRTR